MMIQPLKNSSLTNFNTFYPPTDILCQTWVLSHLLSGKKYQFHFCLHHQEKSPAQFFPGRRTLHQDGLLFPCREAAGNSYMAASLPQVPSNWAEVHKSVFHSVMNLFFCILMPISPMHPLPSSFRMRTCLHHLCNLHSAENWALHIVGVQKMFAEFISHCRVKKNWTVNRVTVYHIQYNIRLLEF